MIQQQLFIQISDFNATYCRIQASQQILDYIHDSFSYFADGYRFMPKYKEKMWDGKIRLFNPITGMLYRHLITQLITECQSQGWSVIDNRTFHGYRFDDAHAEGFINALNITSNGQPIQFRDYQIETIKTALKNDCGTIVSPTASGKSLSIYAVVRHAMIIFRKTGRKSLIIVPNVQLVEQLASDFADYSSADPSFNADASIHKIMSGIDKDSDKPMFISTWQSMMKVKDRDSYFTQFHTAIVDECFVAGTPIDGIGIEKLKIGDIVKSFNENTNCIEYKKIKRIFKNKIHERMIHIHTILGVDMHCTENHPFYIDGKWIPAKMLKRGDMMYNITENPNEKKRTIQPRNNIKLFDLWKGSGSTKKNIDTVQEKRKGFLLQRAWRRISKTNIEQIIDRDEQKICISENEIEKSDAQSYQCGKSINNKKNKWNSEYNAMCSWWKWKNINTSTIISNIFRVAARICSIVKNGKGKWISYLLQNRYSQSNINDWYRGGWKEPLWKQCERTRYKEGIDIKRDGVDYIEIYESGSCDKSSEMFGDGFVYNIEVEDNHNYFVNDILVHNCHQADAKCLTYIIEACSNAFNRFGFTGTMKNSTANIMCVRAMMGDLHKVVSTSKLIEDGHLAELDITAIVLKHKPEICALAARSRPVYKDEIKYLITHMARNLFILRLAFSTQGNTLVLFQFVDTHGKILYEMAKKMVEGSGKKIFYISGKIKASERETIRKYMETANNVILFASYGTLSTGVNIKNLDNLIFASPYKSKIKVLQSIGRVLRKATDSAKAKLFDIVDDMRYKKYKNHVFSHFLTRSSYYKDEGYPVKISEFKIQ